MLQNRPMLAAAFVAWLVALLGDRVLSMATSAILGTPEEGALSDAIDAAIKTVLKNVPQSYRADLELALSENFKRLSAVSELDGETRVRAGLILAIQDQLAPLAEPDPDLGGQSYLSAMGLDPDSFILALAQSTITALQQVATSVPELQSLMNQLNADEAIGKLDQILIALKQQNPAGGDIRIRDRRKTASRGGAQARAAIMNRLVDAFAALPTLKHERSRTIVLDLLPGQLSQAVDRGPNLRTEIFGLIMAAQNYPDGLQELIQAVALVEGDSLAMRQLDEVIANLAASQDEPPEIVKFTRLDTETPDAPPRPQAPDVPFRPVRLILSPEERIEYRNENAPQVPDGQLDARYWAASGKIAPRKFGDFSDLVWELEQLMAGASLHPLIVLTEEIANTVHGEGTWTRDWSLVIAAKIDASTGSHGKDTQQAMLAERRKRGLKTLIPVRDRATLCFQLEPKGIQHDHYYLTCWLHVDDIITERIDNNSQAAVDLAGVAKEVRRLVGEAWVILRSLDAGSAGLDIEFIVPERLLSHDFEKCQHGDQWYKQLGLQYTVAVRGLERLRQLPTGSETRSHWENRWKIAQNGRGRAQSLWLTCCDRPDNAEWVCLACLVRPAGNDRLCGTCREQRGSEGLWLTCRERPVDPAARWADLMDSSYAWLGMTYLPSENGATSELHDVLDAGYPIAVWMRGPAGGTAAGHGRHACTGLRLQDELIARLAHRSLADLKKIILELRLEAMRNGLDRDLTLLWDDPYQLPEDGEPQPLEAPPYLGA